MLSWRPLPFGFCPPRHRATAIPTNLHRAPLHNDRVCICRGFGLGGEGGGSQGHPLKEISEPEGRISDPRVCSNRLSGLWSGRCTIRDAHKPIQSNGPKLPNRTRKELIKDFRGAVVAHPRICPHSLRLFSIASHKTRDQRSAIIGLKGISDVAD